MALQSRETELWRCCRTEKRSYGAPEQRNGAMALLQSRETELWRSRNRETRAMALLQNRDKGGAIALQNRESP
jgi:hypothetical protein